MGKAKKMSDVRMKINHVKERKEVLDRLSERPGQWDTVFHWIAFVKELYDLILELLEKLDADDPSKTEK
jgi:hypothetical protein